MIAKSASRLVSLRANPIRAGAAAAYAVQTRDTPSAEALRGRVAAAFPGVALRVERVFETTEGELATHFKVVFEGVAFEDLDATTFEVAYDLMDACDLVAAEPLLPFSGRGDRCRSLRADQRRQQQWEQWRLWRDCADGP